MQGLRFFNLVIIGTGFAVDQIDLQDFQANGGRFEERLRLPVALQATVGEYAIEVVPDRFQVTAKASKTTTLRVEALQAVATEFVRNYASRKGVRAVGHNFSGAFAGPPGGADAFLRQHAWTPALEAALGDTSAPRSLLAAFRPAEPANFGQVRLEPLAEDNSQVFYDANITYGASVVGAPESLDLDAAIEQFAVSVSHVDQVITALSGLAR